MNTQKNLYQAEKNSVCGLTGPGCSTCEYNSGRTCIGYGLRPDNGKSTYQMTITEAKKMFPKGCGSYSISLDAFSEQEQTH